MKVARDSDKAIRLNNSDVLIIGGDKNESAELFNYKNKTFTLITKSIKPYYSDNLTPRIYGDRPEYFGDDEDLFNEPVLMPNDNVFYKGAIYDVETNTFHKPKTIEEQKYLNLFETISSYKLLEKKKYKLQMVFSNGEALFSKNCNDYNDAKTVCSEIHLENPLSNNKYKPAKFKFIYELNNTYPLTAIYMAENSILLIKGEIKDNKKGGTDYIQRLKMYNPLNGTLKNIDINKDLGSSFSFMNLDNQAILLKDYINREMDYDVGYFYSGIIVSKLNLLNDVVTFLGIIPLSSHTMGMFNKKYLLSKGYGYFSVFNLNTKEFYRTLYPHKGLFSEGFVRLNDNEVLITGGSTGDSVYATYLARSKYAAIITIKQEDKSKNN